MIQPAETLHPETDALTEQLALLRKDLSNHTYPEYPERRSRLTADPYDLAHYAGKLALPDGPWSTDNHPKQRHPEHTPDITTQQALLAAGQTLDALGRPLHPWFMKMLVDPSIGVVTGKAAYYHWGPNYTADSIIVCQDHILLAQRQDTKQWALPGGYVDRGETSIAASVREVAEETGLILPADIQGTVVYEGPVVDPRMTAHAWPETTAVLYWLDQNLPDTHAADDVEDTKWRTIDQVREHQDYFGAHQFLLEQAFKHM